MSKIPGDCPGKEEGLGWEGDDDLGGGVWEVAGVNLGDFVEEPTAQALRGVRLPPGGGGRRGGWCAHAQRRG